MTSPIDSQASLSHCSTVRRSIRARSMGQTSPMGRSVSTMPPEWMPRWRGAPISSSASATTGAGTSWAAGSPMSPATTDFQPSICLDQASCWPGEWPSALAASRTAIRGR